MSPPILLRTDPAFPAIISSWKGKADYYRKDGQMKYEYTPLYVEQFMDEDGKYKAINHLMGMQYVISPAAAAFMHFLNGKRDPAVLGEKLGYRPESTQSLLKELRDKKLIRKSRFHYDRESILFGLMFTLWTPSRREPSRAVRNICRAISLVILLLIIPALITSLIMIILRPVTADDYGIWSLIIGYIAGGILHEVAGHLCSALWLGADVYEAGLIPIGAYVMINETGRSPLESAQISAAGIEVNLLTGAVFMILASLLNSRNMLLISSINIGLAIMNASPKNGFDGNSVAEELIRLDLAGYANAVLRDRKIRSQIDAGEDRGKYYAAAFGIRAVQLMLTAAGLVVTVLPEFV